MKRLLNMTASELTHLSKSELIEAIAGSEGRIMAAETIMACSIAIRGIRHTYRRMAQSVNR